MSSVELADSVSLGRLTDLLEGDVDGAREVLGLFLSELPRFQSELEQATAAQELSRVLHRFRGSLLSLGLSETADRLGPIEVQLARSPTWDPSLVVSLCSLFPALAEQTRRELGS